MNLGLRLRAAFGREMPRHLIILISLTIPLCRSSPSWERSRGKWFAYLEYTQGDPSLKLSLVFSLGPDIWLSGVLNPSRILEGDSTTLG